MSSAICLNLDQSKILSSGKELKWLQTINIKVAEMMMTVFDTVEKKNWDKRKCWSQDLVYPAK